MAANFIYNGKHYVSATLLAIANQGALLEMPVDRLVMHDGLKLDHPIPVVVAWENKFVVLAGTIPADTQGSIPVRLLSKIILKKAQVPPKVVQRPYVDHMAPQRGWGNPTGFSDRYY